MADPIQVANSAEQISGKALLTAEDNQVVSGAKSFSRAPLAPFEVESGSAVVTHLDADRLDGEHGADYHNASLLATGTVPGARFPATLPAVSGEALTNLNAAHLTGKIPDSATPEYVDEHLSGLADKVELLGTSVDALGLPMTLLKGVGFSSGSGNAAGGGDTEIVSHGATIPANALGQPGDALTITGTMSWANNADEKTLKLKVGGGTTVTIFSSAAAVASHVLRLEIALARRGSTGGVASGIVWAFATHGTAPTPYLVNVSLGAVDWTTDQAVRFYLASAVESNARLADLRMRWDKSPAGSLV